METGDFARAKAFAALLEDLAEQTASTKVALRVEAAWLADVRGQSFTSIGSALGLSKQAVQRLVESGRELADAMVGGES